MTDFTAGLAADHRRSQHRQRNQGNQRLHRILLAQWANGWSYYERFMNEQRTASRVPDGTGPSPLMGCRGDAGLAVFFDMRTVATHPRLYIGFLTPASQA